MTYIYSKISPYFVLNSEANIVLSRWVEKGFSYSSQSVITEEGDAQLFLFRFGIVFRRGKDSVQKALELLTFLDGNAFKFFI